MGASSISALCVNKLLKSIDKLKKRNKKNSKRIDTESSMEIATDPQDILLDDNIEPLEKLIMYARGNQTMSSARKKLIRKFIKSKNNFLAQPRKSKVFMRNFQGNKTFVHPKDSSMYDSLSSCHNKESIKKRRSRKYLSSYPSIQHYDLLVGNDEEQQRKLDQISNKLYQNQSIHSNITPSSLPSRFNEPPKDKIFRKPRAKNFFENKISFPDYRSEINSNNCITPNASSQKLDKFKLIAGLKFKPRETTKYYSKRKTSRKAESLKAKGKLKNKIQITNDLETIQKAYKINENKHSKNISGELLYRSQQCLEVKENSISETKSCPKLPKFPRKKLSTQVDERIRHFRESQRRQISVDTQDGYEELKTDESIRPKVDTQLETSIIEVVYKPKMNITHQFEEKVTATPKTKMRINESLESRITKKVVSYCKAHYSGVKCKKLLAKITHQFCANSQYNTCIRYWEMFCIIYHLLTSKVIVSSDHSTILMEILKLMSFKPNRTSDYLDPSKELFNEVKTHCLHSMLTILNGSANETNCKKISKIDPMFSSNILKAFVLPHNNGKIVASVLKRRGWWKIYKNQHDYNFIWTPLLRKDLAEQLPSSDPKPGVVQTQSLIYNRVDGNYNLSNKKNLFLNMKEYYNNMGENMNENIPLTFLVQEDTKEEAMTDFKEHYISNKANKRNNKWILKPGEYTNRGTGIKISDKLSTIEKYVQNSKRDCCVIQKYINNPLLINNGSSGNRKFDIRCFGLYTCFNNQPKGYFFQDGYLRTASKEFSHSNVADKFIHLTNDAIQKKCEEYGKYESSNKLSFNDFQKYLEKKYPKEFQSNKACFYTSIYPKIKTLVSDSFKAVEEKLNPSQHNNCFELFGYDFMVTNDFNIKLIEVNTNPCLETPCSLLSSIISSVVDNTFRVTLDPWTYKHNGKTQELCDSANNLCKFELVYQR
ncbi:unnamed protein product [Moneuplotes crassus]|uniref:Tubulin-tyrosine ligase family protein n=1 Tax=Euplotes crassus TaxID=5936 RepID=A0AAD2CYG4_EUPCR|nr:unnamed protein product [Moneuplotes crassus]